MVAATQIESALHDVAAAHRHLCPRQVLGVRMGVRAGELLGLPIPQSNKRLYAFVETDGCFVDGVTAATGCSLGHRTMRLMDQGKVAATFVDTTTLRAIRIWAHQHSRVRALDYVPNAPTRWHAQLEAYQSMPSAELLCTCDVDLTIDLRSLIGTPGGRVACSGCGEEILNGREVLHDGRMLCSGCACGNYFRSSGSSTES